MNRRVWITAFLAWPLRADSAQDVWEALTEIASALGRGNAAAFAAALHPDMAGYEAQRENVAALLRQAEVQCSLDLVDNTGDDRERSVVVEWLLVLTERTETQRATRRRESVRCGFAKRGKKWLMTKMEPADFLKPPQA